MLDLVGLSEVARKRSKGFSLGMGQRLGIAAALLGDPAILMFDEPVNGLDPEGILWIRNLMKALAAEGRTVFVSSHLMSEMENTADHLLVIGRGRLIADCTRGRVHRAQLGADGPGPHPAGATRCAARSRWPAATSPTPPDGAFVVQGLAPDQIGDLAFERGIRLHELAQAHASLEQAFMELTASSVEFHASDGPTGAGRRQATGDHGRGGLTWPRRHSCRAVPRRPCGPLASGRAGFGGALRSEFTKIRSVRSTYWTLIALVVVTIGIGALACVGAVSRGSGIHGPGFDATQRSLAGLILGQLIIVVLGALTVTSEYSTGMIRTSLTVQPRRGTVLAAKGVVFTLVSLVTGLVASFVSFFIGQAILSSKHLDVSLGDPNVLRAVIGGGLFLAVCGMLAFGLGTLLRHTAGAITASIGLLFVLFVLINFLPSSWQNHVDKWIPFNAGSQIWSTIPVHGNPPMFSPWTGFAVFAGYAVIAIIAGAVAFRKRDA